MSLKVEQMDGIVEKLKRMCMKIDEALVNGI